MGRESINKNKDEYKTTAAHFKLFQQQAKRWIKKLGMFDWEYNFFHEDWNKENRATVCYSVFSRTASLCLAPVWNTPIELGEVKKAAFHEVMEIMLADICVMAESRTFDGDKLEAECHRVIRRLENVVLQEGEV